MNVLSWNLKQFNFNPAKSSEQQQLRMMQVASYIDGARPDVAAIMEIRPGTASGSAGSCTYNAVPWPAGLSTSNIGGRGSALEPRVARSEPADRPWTARAASLPTSGSEWGFTTGSLAGVHLVRVVLIQHVLQRAVHRQPA